jgi:hypothetical protein
VADDDWRSVAERLGLPALSWKRFLLEGPAGL